MAEAADDLDGDADGKHCPREPADDLHDGDQQRAVVGADECLPQCLDRPAEAGCGDVVGGDEQEREADYDDRQAEGGGDRGESSFHVISPFRSRPG